MIVHQVAHRNIALTSITLDEIAAGLILKSHTIVTHRLILTEEATSIGTEVAQHQSDMDQIDTEHVVAGSPKAFLIFLQLLSLFSRFTSVTCLYW